jgi:hypothetical protein
MADLTAPRRATVQAVQDVQAVQNVRGTADSIVALVWSFKNPIFFERFEPVVVCLKETT